MTDKLISDLGAVGAAISDNTAYEVQRNGQTTTEQALHSDLKTYVKTFASNGGPPAALAIANVYASNPASAVTTGAVAALRLYMLPVYWYGGTATTFAFTVTTGAAGGSTARVGIYNIKADGGPGTLVVEPTSGGAIATDSTGTKTQAFSQALNPGWYYLAFITQGTPTMAVSTESTVCLGNAISGTAASVPVTYIYRALGALAALGDETGNTFTASGVASARPTLGIK